MGSAEFTFKVKEVLNNMTDDQKEKIKRNHPFRREREKIIRFLSAKGVEGLVIAEISGVSNSSISRIIKAKNDDNIIDPENNTSLGVSFETGMKMLCRLLSQLVQKN